MRYFQIDRIDELERFKYATGRKAVALSEDVFEHHFPGQPVYPGALLLEAMAQLGGALLEISLRDGRDHCPRCVLSTANTKFREFARPGDVIEFRAEVLRCHEESGKVRVRGMRGEQRVCEAELLYVFLRIDDPRLEASRRDYLDILTRSTHFVDAT